MKAYLKRFTGSCIQKQIIGGADEMCETELDCTFFLDDGQRVECKTRITQTGGSAYSDKIIDVDPVEGLPADAEYDHEMFAEVAAHYFNDLVLKQGN